MLARPMDVLRQGPAAWGSAWDEHQTGDWGPGLLLAQPPTPSPGHGATLNLTAVTLTLVKATQPPGATTCVLQQGIQEEMAEGVAGGDWITALLLVCEGITAFWSQKPPWRPPSPAPCFPGAKTPANWPSGHSGRADETLGRRGASGCDAGRRPPHRALTTSSAVIFNIVTLGQQPAPQPQRLQDLLTELQARYPC